jgi:hypothetical protein
MMGHRLRELEMRRQRLLLRSERLRAELASDQRYVLQALGGFDRFLTIAKGFAKPLLFSGAGLLLLSFLRRARPARFAMRTLVWVSMARKLLPFVGLIRAFVRSRSKRPPPESAESP